MDVLPVAIPVNSNDTSDDAAWRDAKPTFGTFNFFREEYLDSRRTREREREWVDSRNRKRLSFRKGKSSSKRKNYPADISTWRDQTTWSRDVINFEARRMTQSRSISPSLLVLSKVRIAMENNARLFASFSVEYRFDRIDRREIENGKVWDEEMRKGVGGHLNGHRRYCIWG